MSSTNSCSHEIYDCTPREGAQAEGVSFSRENLIRLAQMLDSFGVDYIELGWPYANNEIKQSFSYLLPKLKKAKLVAFGSTSKHEDPKQDPNLISILETGAKYACIFGKTDISHVTKQLQIALDENLARIEKSVAYLKSKGLTVFYDAEHYFDAFKNDSSYALKTLEAAIKGGAERLILCDTRGGNLPSEIERIVRETYNSLKKYGVALGVHFHDDCDLAIANTLVSLPYIKQIQGTINGIGERVGNLNLATFLSIYSLKLNQPIKVDLKSLKKLTEEAWKLCGLELPDKIPFVGKSAFANKGGVHIDAEFKGATYFHIDPFSVGNKPLINLNTLGGRSSVIETARKFGYVLKKQDPYVQSKIRELFEELGELERKGYRIGLIEAEQFLLIEKYFNAPKNYFEILSWNMESSRTLEGKEFSTFYAILKVKEKLVDCRLSLEGGPVDAAFNSMKTTLSRFYPSLENLHLTNFHVEIALPKEEKSSVRTEISFRDGMEEFSTVGVDENIFASTLEALQKAFHYFLTKWENEKGNL